MEWSAAPRKHALLIAVLLMSLNALSAHHATCKDALEKHVLTCDHLEWSPVDASAANPIAEQITNDTVVLILKDSPRLSLSAAFHTPAQFVVLTSYQVVNANALKIAPKTFSKLNRLEYIKICDNRYGTVEANTFESLGKLKLLNLNNNSIQSLQADAFNGLVALETLEMTHNDVKTLPEDVFSDLGSLKSLFLYHNKIEVLEDGCLNGLRNLNVLDLTYNRIARINAEAFNALPIAQLYLSYNQIEDIAGYFRMPNLEFLYLQNNKLRSIDDSLFSSLVSLQDVDISRNRIADLSSLAFFNCTKLANLNYKENALRQRVEFEFAGNATDPFITA